MAGDELKVPSQRNDDTRDGSDHDLTGRYAAGKVPTGTDPLDTPPTDHDPKAEARKAEGRKAEARDADVLHADARMGDVQRADARKNDVTRAEAQRPARPGDDRAGTDTGVAPASPSPAPPGAGADREPVFRDGPYAHGGGHEQARPGETAAAHAAPGEVVLFERDPAEVQARWRDLQASFVDDPSEAVQRADGLVGEVVESLTSTLNSRTAALRDRWKSAGASGTEEMRQALREYRDVLERLLALSGSSLSQSSPAVPAASPRSGNEVT